MPDIESSPAQCLVTFTHPLTKTSTTAPWSPSNPISILELAESVGLKPDFGCRSGMCGTCEVRLLSGKVDGPEGDMEPEIDGEGKVVRGGGILICSSRPLGREIVIELGMG